MKYPIQVPFGAYFVNGEYTNGRVIVPGITYNGRTFSIIIDLSESYKEVHFSKGQVVPGILTEV